MFAHKFACAVASLRGPVVPPSLPQNQSSCYRFSTDVSRTCDRPCTPHAGPQHPPRRIKVHRERDPGFTVVEECHELERSAASYDLQIPVENPIESKDSVGAIQVSHGVTHIDFSYLDVIRLAVNSMGGDQTSPSESSKELAKR